MISPLGVTLENGFGDLYLARFSMSLAIRLRKPTFFAEFEQLRSLYTESTQNPSSCLYELLLCFSELRPLDMYLFLLLSTSEVVSAMNC